MAAVDCDSGKLLHPDRYLGLRGADHDKILVAAYADLDRVDLRCSELGCVYEGHSDLFGTPYCEIEAVPRSYNDLVVIHG